MKFSDFWVVWWKFTKFLVSYLKPQVSFSLNLVSLFNVMRDNCSVLYLLKLYIILAKVTHESPKFQTFNCSHEISPNLYFHRVLLLKVYRISAKKSIEKLFLQTLKSDAEFEENWFLVSKMRRIWCIFTWTLEILKISTLIGLFCAKYITFELKKYRGIIFLNTKEWCKFWRRID